jgi:hypothetical protein
MKYLPHFRTRGHILQSFAALIWAVLISVSLYLYFFQPVTPLKSWGLILALVSLFFVIFQFLLSSQLLPGWKNLDRVRKYFMVLIGMGISFLACFGLSFPSIHVLEPVHSVDISISADKNLASSDSEVELFGFNSGVQWESFDAFQKEGQWIRSNDALIGAEINGSLAWTGSTSAESRLVFICRPDGGKVSVLWDKNDRQVIDLYCPVRTQVQAVHSFPAPHIQWNRLLSVLVISLSLFICIMGLLIFLSRFLINTEKAPVSQNSIDIVQLIPSPWKSILFTVLCLIIAYLQIGNFQGRLATIYTDDAPPAYSYLFVHPERFTRDIISTFGQEQTFATMQNWLPAFLYRYLLISPQFSTLILLLAQFLLLGFSVVHFTKVITHNETVGWLTAFFIFGANPWEWNMANYANVMFMTYAGHLVMPFILYAFSDLLEENNSRAMIWLFVGGLIHPTLILYSIGMIAIYWAVKYRFKVKLTHWVFLVLVALSATLPRFLLLSTFGNGDLLTFKEMEYAFRNNMHTHPIFRTPRVQCFLFFLPLIFLSFRETSRVFRKYLYLWISVAAGCAVLILLSLIGWKFEILYLIQLIPQRSTTLLVFASLPLFLAYLYRNITGCNQIIRYFSILFIFSLILLQGKFFDLPWFGCWLLLLVFVDSMSGSFGPLELPRIKPDVRKVPPTTAAHSKWLNPSLSASGMLIVVLIVTFNNSWLLGAPARSRSALANYEMQIWARDNLPASSMIIGMGRSVSEHPSLDTVAYRLYVYNRSRITKDYVDKVQAFYDSFYQETKREMSTNNMDEHWIKRFASDFGADYIVRGTSFPLDFEEVYRNDQYIVYKIPAG